MLALVGMACSVAAWAQDESLINPSSYRAIAADHRAYRIGDILTINVQESVSAKSGASTDASGSLGIQGSVATAGYQGSANANLGAKNADGAETSRVGEFKTRISARVVGLEPTGVLWVEGEQTLLVNGEKQNIVIKGSVRPEDIAADNSVWSYRLADAKVELSGNGVVSRSQRQSVLYSVLKWLRLL
ncbi:MAG TPA: flagellar basal body L-ring protein FlgH [Rhodanobacter sp.]